MKFKISKIFVITINIIKSLKINEAFKKEITKDK